MSTDTTALFDVEELNEAIIKDTLKEVYEALEERHYNPVNQLVGYLMSGDPGYISNHREARTKISKLDRTKILEILVRDYVDCNCK
ncbi:MAG: IreB family regulatory phosphoprotein [Bacilli bacterium]|nr:IreB family regulatory phosphoprotein [Bacilli bacterium]